MAKSIPFKTKCPCGRGLISIVKKPKKFTPSVGKITCDTCQSKFLVTCKKTTAEGAKFVIEILELSEVAKRKIKLNPLFQAKMGIAKVKNAVGMDPIPE